MKKTQLLSAFVLSIGILLCLPQKSISQKIERQLASVDGQIAYAYHLPPNFDEEKTYPVLLSPGDVKAGAEAGYFFRNLPDDLDWILVEGSAFFAGSAQANTKKLLDHLRTQFKVEGNKFHIIGFSANSAPIYKRVLEAPEYFHSITTIPGYPRTTEKKKLQQLKTVKNLFLVGDQDTFWFQQAKKSHQQLQDMGIESKIEIFQGAGHFLTQLRGRPLLDRIDTLR